MRESRNNLVYVLAQKQVWEDIQIKRFYLRFWWAGHDINHTNVINLGFWLTGPVQQFATAFADSGSDKN